MKFFAGLAALASLAAAAPSGAPTPLDVQLEKAGNSLVKAIITNTGKNDLKVFKIGTIFDTAPTEKVKVKSAGQQLGFEGIRLRIDHENLEDSDFQKIPAGKSVEVIFDVAETHNLSNGGDFDVVTAGILQYAEAADHKLIGSVPFSSNTLTSAVNGLEAAVVRNSIFARYEKRTKVQSDCTGDRLKAGKAALSSCASFSQAASKAASSGPAAKLDEYFKSSTSATRKRVAGVFDKVARECGSTTAGVSTFHCKDSGNHCQPRVLAYTVPSQSYMAYCDIFWNNLPSTTTSCHRQDQATTVLHEVTHLSQIAGTGDNGYGYDNIRKLSSEKSLTNADSYAMYANAIHSNC